MSETWFIHPVQVYPHHTDYAGIVWHGAYITWMEEARVAALKALSGLAFADFVAMGCDLPVVGLTLRYHRAATMGTNLQVKTRLQAVEAVRLPWEYRIESEDGSLLYLTGTVTLAPVDPQRGRVLRRLPPPLQLALAQLQTAFC